MNQIWIYSDGACSGNPGPGGWACLIAFLGERDHVVERGGGESRTTNNRMEMESVIQALAICPENEKTPIEIFSDSKLLIQGATQWLPGWKAKKWVKSDGQPVANVDLWERLDRELVRFRGRLRWTYVPGHAGVEGNERADAIAVAFSKQDSVALFEGPLTEYPHASAFRERPSSGEAEAGDTKSRKSKGSKAGGYYLSLLDNRLERHATWAECEARVKGKSGAKFKKVSGAADEELTLRSWKIARN